ncbi:protein LURP-one-related 5-like [Impatiens glandulifera]|uniref:protein LURP-one-related 5-like n=1 Tax=Impatiens glandulifera TaxID=253017 RepID=UPI001FB155E6|nr:protein LURP-one-related 5-like [Impatiens glandulifera]
MELTSAPIVMVDDRFVCKQETHFTVLKTSLFFAGDGFTAYNPQGKLVFRVDSYGGPDTADKGQVVLMDASGSCLLTVRKKRGSLHHRWEGYRGEGSEGKNAIFSVRKSSMIGRCDVEVDAYGPALHRPFLIAGCFANRHSTIVDVGGGRTVAEIRRKVDSSTKMELGKDVFSMCVKPGFDGAFAMGLMLVLDQINANNHFIVK